MSARLPISKPSDIGAIAVQPDTNINPWPSNQTVNGEVTTEGYLNIKGKGLYFGDYDHPQEGVHIGNIGIDAWGLMMEVGDWVGTSPDRFGIGLESPFRVWMGGVNSPMLNTPGQPFFKFSAMNDPGEQPYFLEYLGDSVGTIFSLQEFMGTRCPLRISQPYEANSLVEVGDLTVGGNLIVAGGQDLKAQTPGLLCMSDGTDYWKLTVNSSGTLGAVKLEKNMYPYPRDPSKWSASAGTGLPAVPPSLPTGMPADTEAFHWTLAAGGSAWMNDQTMRSGLTPGLTYTFSTHVYVASADAGSHIGLDVPMFSSTEVFLDETMSSWASLAPGWQRLSVTMLAPAGGVKYRPYIYRINATGVNLDLWNTGFMLEEHGDMNDYFDGGYADCFWQTPTGANSTPSYKEA